jgi:hypothetical protein
LCGTGATARAARAECQRRAARHVVQPRVRVRMGRGMRELERACAGKAGSRDARIRGRVREKRGGVAREPEAGQRGRVVLGNRGRREKKGGEGKRKEKKREGKNWKKKRGGKEKRRRKENGEKEKEKEKWWKEKKGKREREKKGWRALAIFAAATAAGRPRARDVRTLREEKKGGGVTAVGFGCRLSGWRGKTERVRARVLTCFGDEQVFETP